MNQKYLLIITVTVIVTVGFAGAWRFFDTNKSAIHSSYGGQEAREIKSLSQDDIRGLLSGAGTPFGGMAKPAELNGYPGPRHVLDAMEAGEFEMSDGQRAQIQNLYDEMKKDAIALGRQMVAVEQKIDDEFTDETVTEESLQNNIAKSARIYEQLRFVHLKYHLKMVDILTPEQITQYNILRGYIGNKSNPCDKVPEGHDSDLWKIHNNCE